MPSITPLSYSDTIDNNKRPIKADLDAIFDEFQAYINDLVVDNLEQLGADSYGSYGFVGDTNGLYTNNLYDKLTVNNSVTLGNYTVATVGSWTQVDAANAKIDVTPERVGDFAVRFAFVVEIESSGASNNGTISFRLNDGSEVSTFQPQVKVVSGVAGSIYQVPVEFTHEFSDWAASAQSVILEYFITTATNVTIKVLANSTNPLVAHAEKI